LRLKSGNKKKDSLYLRGIRNFPLTPNPPDRILKIKLRRLIFVNLNPAGCGKLKRAFKSDRIVHGVEKQRPWMKAENL
jgi:hypothetical protein